MAKQVIPSIHIPIQEKDGSISWVWYMFLKYLSSVEGGSGASSLSQLSDVNISSPTNNQYLVYDNGIWNNQTLSISWGQIGGDIEDQIDLKNALDSKQGVLTAGTNITIDENNVISATGDSLPDQTGNAGKFLTTNGTDASWGTTLTETLYLTGDNTQNKIVFNDGNNDSQKTTVRATWKSILFEHGNDGTFTQAFSFSWLYKAIYPIGWRSSDVVTLGTSDYKWSNVYTKKINNGADIDVPNQAGTMVVADPTGATQGRVLTLDSNLKPAWADASGVGGSVYTKAQVDEKFQEKATAVNYNNITNCLTHIPQDIKLELNNGTLTLKAGSKVYVPNGDGVFDTITIANDISHSISTNTVYAIGYNHNTNEIYHWSLNDCYSGGTEPSSNYALWYDTTNNLVKQKVDGVIVSHTVSLPIAIITVSNGAISSIDQVFNGFGYIGSTVFALPGVKGLIPNGRNADGSLKNTTTNDFTIVKTVQVTTSTAKIAMYSGGGLGSQTVNFELNEPENYNYDTDVLSNALEVARVIVDSSAKITVFTPKTAFHAVDYSGADFVVSFQRPTAENNYTWYRKYKSGWVEQGGLYIDDSGSGSTEYSVVFPIIMANNTYITSCFTDEINYDSTSPNYPLFCSGLTTTGMTLKAAWRRANYRYHWEVKGVAAS